MLNVHAVKTPQRAQCECGFQRAHCILPFAKCGGSSAGFNAPSPVFRDLSPINLSPNELKHIQDN